jgi:hypothetical protein
VIAWKICPWFCLVAESFRQATRHLDLAETLWSSMTNGRARAGTFAFCSGSLLVFLFFGFFFFAVSSSSDDTPPSPEEVPHHEYPGFAVCTPFVVG